MIRKSSEFCGQLIIINVSKRHAASYLGVALKTWVSYTHAREMCRGVSCKNSSHLNV